MKHSSAFAVTFGGLSCGGTLLLLYLSSVVPTGALGLLALSGFFPFFVMQCSTPSGGILCWGACSFLSVLILPQKVMACLFAFCFGLYPLLKYVWERYPKMLAWILKCFYATTSFVLCENFFRFLLVKNTWFHSHSLPLFFVFFFLFLVYDHGLSQVFPWILHHLDPFLSHRR